MQSLATALGTIVTPVGLPSIKRIYTGVTEKIPTTAEIPCIIIFRRRPSNVSFHTFGYEKNETEFVLQLVVNPVGQSTLYDNYNDTIQYADCIHAVLYAHLQLFNAGNDGVRWSLPKVDGRPGLLQEQWNSQQWFGEDFLVSVMETKPVTLGV